MRAITFALLCTAACSGDSSDDTIDFGSGTSGAATSSASSSSSGEASESSSTTTASGEPGYPRPDPVAPDGTCPADAFGPITFDGTSWVCLPECGDGEPTCPPPATGSAMAACATNPFSSATPCSDSSECTEPMEMCGNAGNGQMGCLLPPSHCILQCDAGATCPDEMVCTGAGVCAYPA